MNIYCSQLGLVIDFSYCVSCLEGLPCRNTVECWRSRIDVTAFLNRSFTGDELMRSFGGLPKSRIDRLVEAIASVQREE